MIYLPIGRREQGKTTLAYSMARKVERRLVFDPRGVIRQGTTATTQRAFVDAFRAMHDAIASPELLDGPAPVEVVFTPDGDVQEGFEFFAWHVREWVKLHPEQPLAVLVDEAAFVNQETTAFLWVLRCCNRDTVHVWLTAHRPSDISTKVRAIADHWLLFACRQEHDLRVVMERCGPATVATIKKLGARQFVQWDDARGQLQLFSRPEDWYIALDAQRPLRASNRRARSVEQPAVSTVVDDLDLFS